MLGFGIFFKKYVTNDVEVTYLEIREYYKSWNLRQFDDSFADLVNRYDLLVIGGGIFSMLSGIIQPLELLLIFLMKF